MTSNCFIMGDFNLDLNSIHRPDYIYKLPMNSLSNFALDNNLFQVVNFNTWSCIIKGIKKESSIDHVYVNNLASVNKVFPYEPCFGDHKLIVVELNLLPPVDKTYIMRRDRSNYLPTYFNNKLLYCINSSGINFVFILSCCFSND